MSKKEENKLPFSISRTKKRIKRLQKLGWKGSVLFIAFFVLLGALIAYYQKNNQSDSSQPLPSNPKLEQTQEKLTVDSVSQSRLEDSNSASEKHNEVSQATATRDAEEEKEEDKEEEQKKATSEPQMSSQSVSSQFNNLTMPLQGEIVSNCEWYKDPTLDAWKYNSGVDIQGEIGAQIKAVQAGEVIKIIRDDYQGLTIIIKHNEEYSSSYSGLEESLVKKGEDITKNQAIGKLGDSGATNKSELHFEIIKEGKTVDPMDYFN